MNVYVCYIIIDEDGDENVETIGVFSTEENAQKALDKAEDFYSNFIASYYHCYKLDE